ncbi:MAG: CHASE4 domain-containing protein [Candidatus Moraniibacteriota bacterium]
MLSLRNKMYLILLLVTVFFLVIVYGLIWRSTESELRVLQRDQAESQLSLVERILNREMVAMSTRQADWARWDDTYTFITDRNEQYIASNLNDESLEVIDVDIMAFVDNSGQLVYGKQVYDGASGKSTIPEKLLNNFLRESDLLDFNGLVSVKQGILTFPDVTILVSAQPITTSDGKGVRRGTLIFASYIDENYNQMLSAISGLNVRLEPYGFLEAADDGKDLKILQPSSSTVVEYKDGMVSSQRLIANVFGNPALLLRVEYPSKIIEQGRLFLWSGFWYSIFAFISYVSVLVVLIDRLLLRRIENMRRIARQVGVMQSGGLPEGDIDDFAYLATVMMGAIKNIQQSNDVASGSMNELSKFRIALNQSFDHMVITDVEGKILYANLAAEELTGYSQEEIIGQTPALWGRQMPADFYREFWDTIRLHKKMFEGEIVNKHKNGNRYRAKIRVTPVLDSKKRVLYFIGVERLIGKA